MNASAPARLSGLAAPGRLVILAALLLVLMAPPLRAQSPVIHTIEAMGTNESGAVEMDAVSAQGCALPTSFLSC